MTCNSRRSSEFVRKTRQKGLLFDPTPRVRLDVNDHEIIRALPFDPVPTIVDQIARFKKVAL